MYAIFSGFTTALFLTLWAIPPIIRIATSKSLFDLPNDRSAHREPTPSFGGIAIFAGTVVGMLLWTPAAVFSQLQYTLAAFAVLFFVGVQDDLLCLSPRKKVLGQLVTALILVLGAGIRFSGLYGILGINALPLCVAVPLTVVFFIGLINAFNMIDGINGLAGTTGLLICLASGAWFYGAGYLDSAVVAFCLAGSLTGFLWFNARIKALIFMGDTGSMLVGVACAMLAVLFMEYNYQSEQPPGYDFSAAPPLAIAFLFLPLFDMIRVVIIRLLSGRSPFAPGREHIHHVLIDSGLNHLQATGALLMVNLLVITLPLFFNDLGNFVLFIIELLWALLFALALRHVERRRLGRKTRVAVDSKPLSE